MYLIVGLGNPGTKYENTRHNLGFKVLDLLASTNSWEAKYDSQFLKLEDVILTKPQTFMNNSGQAVSQILKFYPDAELIVVHDELDLPLGSIRVQKNSSPAGHNGVKSIIESIGTQDFIRVRIGIDNPDARGQMPAEDFVLRNFESTEQDLVKESLEKALAAIESLETQGLEQTQSRFNG
jgi:PTH1 family peptidyl-tRNA hydrolase